jgi:uncharacterized membrane protein
VIAAVATLAGLVAVALAIDLGRLYYVQRNLQRMANMAALDSARVAGGCMGMPANAAAAAYGEAVGSVVRNGGKPDNIGGDGVLIGRMIRADGERAFEARPEEKNRAVQVSLQSPAPNRLLPLNGSQAFVLHATAAAYSRPAATVVVGSKLAEVSPEILNSLLGPMLGGKLAIDGATYRNLLGVDVPLNGVLEHLEIGSPEDLLDIPITVPDLLRALAQTLTDQGNAAEAAGANALADASGNSNTVTVRDLVGMDGGTDPASGALVDAGTLIVSALQVANGDNLINLLIGGMPPVKNTVVDLAVIEAARQAVLTPGDSPTAYARNAQVALEAAIPIQVGSWTGKLKLFVQTAEATAQIDEIMCGRRDAVHDTVLVGARSALVRLGIGEFDDIRAPQPQPRPVTLLDLPPIVLGPGLPTVSGVRITGYAIATIGRAENVRMDPYVGPFPEGGITHQLGTPPATAMAAGVADMLDNLQLDIELPAGLPKITSDLLLAQLRPVVDNELRPLLAQVLNQGGTDLLQGLTAALGASIAGADVTVLKVVAEEPFLFAR